MFSILIYFVTWSFRNHFNMLICCWKIFIVIVNVCYCFIFCLVYISNNKKEHFTSVSVCTQQYLLDRFFRHHIKSLVFKHSNHILTVAKTNTDNVDFKGHSHKSLGGREHSIPSENSCGQAECRREEKNGLHQKDGMQSRKISIKDDIRRAEWSSERYFFSPALTSWKKNSMHYLTRWPKPVIRVIACVNRNRCALCACIRVFVSTCVLVFTSACA